MRRQTIGLVVASLTFTAGVAVTAMWIVYGQLAVPPAVVRKEPVKIVAPQTAKKSETTRPQYLKAIEILDNGNEYPLVDTPTKFEDLTLDTIQADVGLGESVENQVILLRANPVAPPAGFKIEQQFETSLTIMDEGPHVDLTEWRHYRSPWKEIKKLGPHKFLTSEIPESERERFPKVTREEIYRAVLDEVKSWDPEDRDAGSRWARLARECKSVTDYPCAVSVSKIRFRIMVRAGDGWKPIKHMDFLIPMGC